MPPRKKARRAASTPSRQAAEHVVEEAPEPMDIDSGKEDFALDAWTDEQEISLFKSMVRWKPVGWFLCRPTSYLKQDRSLVLIFH